MTQCIGVKPDGELCRGIATGGSDYCPAHDPSRQEARKRSASKAARSKKPQREIADIKEQVTELIQAVRDKVCPDPEPRLRSAPSPSWLT